MNAVNDHALTTLSQNGALRQELVPLITNTWLEYAAVADIDLKNFPRTGTLQERVVWARGRGLSIGTILTRYSTKDQDSTEAQAAECLKAAVEKNIYVPPEYVCADEGVSGRKTNRDGLNRVRQILASKLVEVLLVYKLSRLFRKATKGYQFFEEELVEAGLRGISVSQGIDTANCGQWKLLIQVHGITDELFLTTTADHVLSGMEQAFRRGEVIGALNIGFKGVEIPGARPTAKGLPRRAMAIDEPVADQIRKHFQLVANGRSLRGGWRKWNSEVGLYDCRSHLKYMSYCAYRRLLSNPRYKGEFSFKRMQNVWQTKRDCVKQVRRPPEEVVTLQFEHLRIVDEALFQKVQLRLNSQKTGPRKRRTGREVQLWDLVHQYFTCPHCNRGFQMWGNHGLGMHCKSDLHCHHPLSLDRQTAVIRVCDELTRSLQQDAEMITAVISEVQQQDPFEFQKLRSRLEELRNREETLTRTLCRTRDLLKQVPDDQAAELNEDYKSTAAERARVQGEKMQVEQALNTPLPVYTPEEVRGVLGNLTQLLTDGAAGRLGEDQVHQAAELFAALVNRCIEVHAVPRPGRQWVFVKGIFVPALLATVRRQLNDPRLGGSSEVEPVELLLRQPPLRERLADEVHRLIDQEGHNATDVAKILSAEHGPMSPDVVRLARKRWYELRGETAPKLPHWRSRARERKTAG